MRELNKMFQSYFCNNLLNIPTLLSLKLIFFFCNMPIQVKSHFNLCHSHVNQEHVTHIFFHHIKKNKILNMNLSQYLCKNGICLKCLYRIRICLKYVYKKYTFSSGIYSLHLESIRTNFMNFSLQ